MPHITTDDGVRLYYEEAGSGAPVVFVHEFAGDYRSWEPQVRYLSRRYRCIAFNARGWPPSGVPEDVPRYSQARACDDIRSVLDGLKIDKAHIVGLSMGGFATLHFGLTYPSRARSVLVAGAGYGSERGEREKFRAEAVVIAAKLEKEGMAAFAEAYAYGPTRVQFENKDPRGFAEFKVDAGGAFRQGRGQYPARRAARAPVDLRSGGQACRLPGADAGRHGRRGLAVPAARRLHQAHLPDRRPARDPQQRPRRSTSRSRAPSTQRWPIFSLRRLPAAGPSATRAPSAKASPA